MFNSIFFFFSKIGLFVDDVGKYIRAGKATYDNIIRRRKIMFACRITKAIIQKPSQYVTLIAFNCNMKCFVAGRQCKGNLLLHFQGITEKFYIVHNYIYANNNLNGMYCCLSVATIVKRKCHNVTLCIYFPSRFIYFRRVRFHGTFSAKLSNTNFISSSSSLSIPIALQRRVLGSISSHSTQIC